jgi:hypothetical protein
MSTQGFVYATKLQTGEVKIGMSRYAHCGLAAAVFCSARVIARWRVSDRAAAEKAAHSACRLQRVSKRELFRDDGRIIGDISAVLGSPAVYKARRSYAILKPRVAFPCNDCGALISPVESYLAVATFGYHVKCANARGM